MTGVIHTSDVANDLLLFPGDVGEDRKPPTRSFSFTNIHKQQLQEWYREVHLDPKSTVATLIAQAAPEGVRC